MPVIVTPKNIKAKNFQAFLINGSTGFFILFFSTSLLGIGRNLINNANSKLKKAKTRKVKRQSAKSDSGPKKGLAIDIFVITAPPHQAANADPKNGPDPNIPKAKGSFSLVKKPASIARAIGPRAASPTPTPILKIIRSQNC